MSPIENSHILCKETTAQECKCMLASPENSNYKFKVQLSIPPVPRLTGNGSRTKLSRLH